MNKIAIQFDHVGKLYQLGTVGTGTLSHDINRWWKTTIMHQEDPYLKIGETNDRSQKGNSKFVWALKDISFNIEEGDVVGIIGKNGAGKSTLLKLLSRVTSPTTGVIRANGRIASLLEVGTGFHPELTGRENIYMNGSIMGMTRKEINRKLDEIINFAGVERYIDTPTKRYSSGMTVRLGFAVAAFLEPEILVVDEVLAVGDAEFQKKAIGKMQDVAKGEGRTVLFVSHNMAAIRSLCNKGIVLKNGCLDYIGQSSTDAINHYLQENRIYNNAQNIKDNIKWLKKGLEVHSIKFNNTEKNFSILKSGDHTINITIQGQTNEKLLLDLMVIFKNKDEVPMASLAEGHNKGILIEIEKGHFKINKDIVLPKLLSKGEYIIDIFLHRPMIEWYMKAPHCAEIQIDGYQEGFGRALKCNEEGFIGLESYNKI